MARAEFIVSVDLDMAPGLMFTEESAKTVLQEILDDRLYGYFPVVTEKPSP